MYTINFGDMFKDNKNNEDYNQSKIHRKCNEKHALVVGDYVKYKDTKFNEKPKYAQV